MKPAFSVGQKRPSIVFVIVGITSIIWLFVRRQKPTASPILPEGRSGQHSRAVGWVAALLVGTAYSQLGPRGQLIYRIGVLAV